MESIIKIIGLDKFQFRRPTRCFKCYKPIKPVQERITFACITGHQKDLPDNIVLKWHDFCNECGEDIKPFLFKGDKK